MNANAYDYGVQEFYALNALITGRICLLPDEAGALAEFVFRAGKGDHLEIGSMWGGTAILAAYVKRIYGLSGSIVCIDPFCDPDGMHGTPNAAIFWDNVKRAGVSSKIELVQAYSNPWPLLPDKRFTSALIDGEHMGEGPLLDWQNASSVTDIGIAIHDVAPYEPDVWLAYETAKNAPGWKAGKLTNRMAALWRKAK